LFLLPDIANHFHSRSNGFSNGGGYGGGGFGGGGDRMNNLGAGLQQQDWGKTLFAKSSVMNLSNVS
jgi:hypothetical protein